MEVRREDRRSGRARRGRNLVLGVLCVDALLLVALGTQVAPELEGWRTLARWSARYALIWFLAAFLASSLAAVWPTGVTRAMLMHRRHLGISFALTHFVHLLILVVMALRWPDGFLHELPASSIVVGGLAYLAILSMAATSNDGAVRRLGAKNWRRLHVLGSHWIWLVLVLGMIPRLQSSHAWLPATLGLVALVPFRLWARRRRS